MSEPKPSYTTDTPEEEISMLDVLRHVHRTYGLDDPAYPLAVVREKLAQLIASMEQYE